MRLASPAFVNNQYIPGEYTCDGLNVNPPLVISEVPGLAKSLVLTMVDLDALTGIWVHWLLYNIDPATSRLEANSSPEGALAGLTSFGLTVYGGPCPPNGVHRYIFKLYALDLTLKLPSGVDKERLEATMCGHVVGQAQLIGLYKRK